MAALNRLTDKRIRNAPQGKLNDGGGLWFIKRPDGGAQWVFRFTLYGKRPEMGLGPYPIVGLSDARRQAVKARRLVHEGKNPIREREREQQKAARNISLLADIAVAAFEARKASLKGEGKAGRWFTPLKLHVLPTLGRWPVSEIDQIAIRDTLAPIWHDKAETARKAMNRLGICLKHAAALGLDVDLQATAKARALLGKQRHTVKHIPSLPWVEVPAFYQSLDAGTITHLALRLLILTGVRSGPLRFLRLEQIAGDVWTIPGEGQKGLRDKTPDFRVPLSSEALAVIEQAKQFERDGYLFPSVRKGVISDATMSRLMQRRGMKARPHGFRSSVRGWVAETTTTTHDAAELILSHATGNKVEQAYKRSDLLEQRRAALQKWANFVVGDVCKVVKIR